MNDQEIIDLWKDIPKLRESMKKDDEITAVVSFAALRTIESGEVDKAKTLLARHVASYYYVYGPPNDPKKKISERDKQFLLQIEAVAKSNSVLQAEISRRMNDKK